MIKVSLNGDWRELEETRLSAAMAAWNYHSEKCAVAVNGEFVPRSAYDQFELRDGDTVDVVAPVGGG